MKAGNVFDGHWVRIARVSFLVISFTSENNCLARIFPLFRFFFFFVFVSPSSVLVRSLTLSPFSCIPSSLLSLSLAMHRHNYKLSAISSVPGRSCSATHLQKKKIPFKPAGAAPRRRNARRVSRLTRTIRISILHLPRTDRFLTWGANVSIFKKKN